MALTKHSRTMLTLGSAIGSILLVMTILGAFPVELTGVGYLITLSVTSTILILESIYEESIRRRVSIVEVMKELNIKNLIPLILAALGYIFGVLFFLNVMIPEMLTGLVAFIISMHAIVIVIERFR